MITTTSCSIALFVIVRMDCRKEEWTQGGLIERYNNVMREDGGSDQDGSRVSEQW